MSGLCVIQSGLLNVRKAMLYALYFNWCVSSTETNLGTTARLDFLWFCFVIFCESDQT